MILRKPWLFIIKYFNIIHLMLFLVLFFVLNRTNQIYILLNEYVKTTGYTYINSGVNYFNTNFIFSLLLIVIIGFVFFILFKLKQKPWVYYLSLTIYYTLLLLLVLITNNIYNKLIYSLMDIRLIGFIKDLWFVCLLIQILFAFLTLLRGIGFNLKKFNFVKDISELGITESDNEEIEVVVNINADKYQQKFNYYKRELIIFVKEKKYLLLASVAVLMIITSISTFINKNVTYKINKVGDTLNINNNQFSVNKAYMSDLDISGNQLIGGYYVIVKFDLTSAKAVDQNLDVSKFSLLYNNAEYSPDIDIYNKLVDLGLGYNNQLTNDNDQYILAFNVKKINSTIAYLRYEKNMYANPKMYYQIKLMLTEDKKQVINIDNNKEINMLLSPLNSKLKINNINFNKQFNDKYQVCIKSDCMDQYDNIDVNNGNEIMVKLNYTINYGQDIAQYVIDNKLLFTQMTKIEYINNYNEKVLKRPNVILGNQKDVVYFKENIDLKTSPYIKLIFNIRNFKYIYRLK